MLRTQLIDVGPRQENLLTVQVRISTYARFKTKDPHVKSHSIIRVYHPLTLSAAETPRIAPWVWGVFGVRFERPSNTVPLSARAAQGAAAPRSCNTPRATHSWMLLLSREVNPEQPGCMRTLATFLAAETLCVAPWASALNPGP